MYNLRYHIASLVAVFLALAMGLLLGSIVVERGVLSSQQTTLVAGLQKDFDQIRAESAALKTVNVSLSAFSAEVAPKIVDGALAGRIVLVIAAPDAGDTVANVTTAVRAAGAKTAVVTFSDVGLSLSDPDAQAAAAKALGTASGSVDETAVVAALAREWTTPGDPRVLTKAISSAGGLKMTGLPGTATVDAVVVAASFAGTPDPSAFNLA
ncbi:MAG TPA: copper transporter, partial [Coriobacteriia bacterium]